MLRIAMLALGASLTIGAIAPHEASAQLNGRQRSRGATTPRVDRRGVTIGTNDRRDDRTGCFDDERGNGHGKHKGKFKDHGRDDRYGKGHDDGDDDDQGDRARDRRDDDHDRGNRYENDRRGDRNCDNVSSRTGARRGNGPPFCRNGQGHPVHGMQWCRDKGWDNGSSLRNTGWQDVILRRPRDVSQRELNRSVLQDVLGQVIYGRIDQQRLRLGMSTPLVGRWIDASNGSILNLFAGGLQVAQILDRNRDGRADVVLLNYGN